MVPSRCGVKILAFFQEPRRQSLPKYLLERMKYFSASFKGQFFVLDSEFGSSRGTPIDRSLIENWLSENIPGGFSGKVLEFGSDDYSRKFAPKASIWIFEYADGVAPIISLNSYIVTGDLLVQDGSLENGFDLIIATQVLAFTKNPFQAALGMKRLLKPGGLIVGTEPFLSQLSTYDDDRWGDYFRFTKKALSEVFSRKSGFENFHAESLGSAEQSLAMLRGFVQEDPLELSKEDSDVYGCISAYTVFTFNDSGTNL